MRPTRTDLVEAHNANIHTLRQQAADARTAARCFHDVSDEIKALNTRGEVFDWARSRTSDFAITQAIRALAKADQLDAEANQMEAAGIE